LRVDHDDRVGFDLSTARAADAGKAGFGGEWPNARKT
jgi:hypothetical protein